VVWLEPVNRANAQSNTQSNSGRNTACVNTTKHHKTTPFEVRPQRAMTWEILGNCRDSLYCLSLPISFPPFECSSFGTAGHHLERLREAARFFLRNMRHRRRESPLWNQTWLGKYATNGYCMPFTGNIIPNKMVVFLCHV